MLGEIAGDADEASFFSSTVKFPPSTQTSQYYPDPSQFSAQSDPYRPAPDPFQQQPYTPRSLNSYGHPGSQQSYGQTWPRNNAHVASYDQQMYTAQGVPQPEYAAPSDVPLNAAPRPDWRGEYAIAEGGMRFPSDSTDLGYGQTEPTGHQGGEYQSALVKDWTDRR